MMISILLLIIPQIKSPYVIGIDAHYEINIAQNTIQSGFWDPNFNGNPVNGALSITIFVPILSLFSSLSTSFINKYIFSIFIVLSVPILWKINKKIFGFGNKLNFFSLFLLIGTSSFMLSPVYSRQESALFLISLLIFLIFFKGSFTFSSKFTFILLTLGLIITHYSSSIIFIGLYICSSLLFIIFVKRNTQLYTLIILNIFLLLLWNILIVSDLSSHFIFSIVYILNTIKNLAFDQVSNVVTNIYSPKFINIFDILNYFINICIIGLLTFGVIYYYNYNKTIKNYKIHYGYFSILLISTIYISLLPGVSLIFNAERFYLIALFFGSGFGIIGFIYLMDKICTLIYRIIYKHEKIINIKSFTYYILMIFIISHFLLQIQLPSQLVYGKSNSEYFEDIKLDIHYTLKEEVKCIFWINAYKINNIITTDFYGRGYLPLQSYGLINPSYITVVHSINDFIYPFTGIYYQQKLELSLQNSISYDDIKKINSISQYLNENNKVYSSGKSNIFIGNK
jgi:uncharacterized membrane protein